MKFLAASRVLLISGIFLILFKAGSSLGLGSDPKGSRESQYSIFSKGLRVGGLKTVCRVVPFKETTALSFESSTHANVNLIFYSYRLDSHEEALVAKECTIKYQRTTREKENTCDVSGILDHGKFTLNISENGKRRTVSFDRDMYDATTMECPEIDLKHEGDEMTMRLLDLETMMIVNRKYHWVKSEEMTVDGRKILCRVVDFEDANKKGRRWIHPDSLGVVIVRQDGKGKSGRYSLRMESLHEGS